MSDDKKAVSGTRDRSSKNDSTATFRDDGRDRSLGSCSNCDTPTIFDGRDTYNPCSCPTVWVNDGRGGYHVTVSRDDDHR